MELPTPPLEFAKACRNIGPDIDEMASSLDQMVAVFLNGVDQEQAAAIRTYLDQLQRSEPTPEQLKDLWWSTPATTVFHDGRDVSSFLMRLRQVLGAEPYLAGG